MSPISCLHGFQIQGVTLAYFITRAWQIPPNYLWCDTCELLGNYHLSQSHCHILFRVTVEGSEICMQALCAIVN